MIPKVRTWKVTVNETGEVLYFDTINKNMVRIILRLDYARLWGKSFKISVVKEKPIYKNYGFSQPVGLED